ncbi:DNA cytosine methyltransferase [Floridanema evergladense]|uniref:Cytosine-specific methyltransferase n=1 Tax=Floridaenema evergladense BLCC-F167 TaxID=3153639 RepID=A0ABV4WID1_9CYAN
MVKKQTKNIFSAVSLFSGAGGMDIGVIQAGFDILASIEIDPYCCETLRTSVSREQRQTQIIENDIRHINPAKLMRDLDIKPGELDLLFGGPPCQSFSQIGKRKCLEDDRGMLLFEMTRFADVFRPKVILIEQVKGLLNAPDRSGKIGGVFELLLQQLQNLNYLINWKIIVAADYGVPQIRERVFIVSTLKPNQFDFPPPTHCPATQSLPLFPLPPYLTVGEAIEGLGKPKSKTEIISENSHVDVTPDGDRRRINGVPEGSYLAKELHLPQSQRGNLAKKDTTKFRRLSRAEPALTLRCGEIFFHPTEDRYLTPREYMRLHGYPDEYLLKGPIKSRSGRAKYLDQHRQIANSVPPPVARILAEAIKRNLECRNSLKSLATR